jgi:hypothetical protein
MANLHRLIYLDIKLQMIKKVFLKSWSWKEIHEYGTNSKSITGKVDRFKCIKIINCTENTLNKILKTAKKKKTLGKNTATCNSQRIISHNTLSRKYKNSKWKTPWMNKQFTQTKCKWPKNVSKNYVWAYQESK